MTSDPSGGSSTAEDANDRKGEIEGEIEPATATATGEAGDAGNAEAGALAEHPDSSRHAAAASARCPVARAREASRPRGNAQSSIDIAAPEQTRGGARG
jgi:hypothetical protein